MQAQSTKKILAINCMEAQILNGSVLMNEKYFNLDGRKLAKLRRGKFLNQEGLAALTKNEVSVANLKKIEPKEFNQIYFSTAQTLATAFKMPIEQFVEETAAAPVLYTTNFDALAPTPTDAQARVDWLRWFAEQSEKDQAVLIQAAAVTRPQLISMRNVLNERINAKESPGRGTGHKGGAGKKGTG